MTRQTLAALLTGATVLATIAAPAAAEPAGAPSPARGKRLVVAGDIGVAFSSVVCDTPECGSSSADLALAGFVGVLVSPEVAGGAEFVRTSIDSMNTQSLLGSVEYRRTHLWVRGGLGPALFTGDPESRAVGLSSSVTLGYAPLTSTVRLSVFARASASAFLGFEIVPVTSVATGVSLGL